MTDKTVKKGDEATGVCSVHGAVSGVVKTASSGITVSGNLLACTGDIVEATCGHQGVINVDITEDNPKGLATLNSPIVGVFKGTIVTATGNDPASADSTDNPDALKPGFGVGGPSGFEAGQSPAFFAATPAVDQSITAASLFDLPPGVSLPSGRADDLIAAATFERQSGRNILWNDPLEYGDAGTPAPAPGGDGSGSIAAKNSFDPANTSTFLNFLSHTDSRISPRLKDIAEQIAQALGETLTITSAYRSPEYNRQVGGATNSMHCKGLALDVVQSGRTNEQRAKFIETAIQRGIQGIGVYDTFTHIDIGSKRCWGSNGSANSIGRYPWAAEVLRRNGYGV